MTTVTATIPIIPLLVLSFGTQALGAGPGARPGAGPQDKAVVANKTATGGGNRAAPAEQQALDESLASIDRIRKGTIVVHSRPGARIEVTQQRHEFRFGTAIGTIGIKNTSAANRHLDHIKQNFNAVTFESSLKWNWVEPTRGAKRYESADAISKWCVENGMDMRGHCVFWGSENQVQGWVKGLSDNDLRTEMKRRAKDVVGRYREHIRDWDIYNEMMHTDYFGKRLGKRIVNDMCRWSLEARPDARLFLNEYNILTGRSSDRYVKFIRDLIQRGVPIGGIGVQGHFGGRGMVNAAQVKSIFDQLWQFKRPIAITEFDINEKDEQVRAEHLRNLSIVAFGHPGLEEITMWGFRKGMVWKPHTHLWDENYQPNAAGRMYQDLVLKQWWTRHQGVADPSGKTEIQAFYGNHRVMVDGRVFDIALEKSKGRIDVKAK